MFMYIDPKLGGLLLEPLFRLRASPNYTVPYAAPDLGAFQVWRDQFRKLIVSNVKGRVTLMSRSVIRLIPKE